MSLYVILAWGHANLLCIIPILISVLLNLGQFFLDFNLQHLTN